MYLYAIGVGLIYNIKILPTDLMLNKKVCYWSEPQT